MQSLSVPVDVEYLAVLAPKWRVLHVFIQDDFSVCADP
jgi:hypothetical protein